MWKAAGLAVSLVLSAMTAEQVFNGAQPSATGQVACSTSSTHAGWCSAFQMPLTGSTTTSPALIGFATGASGTAARFEWGDNNASHMQAAFSDRLQISSYHGIEIWGAQGSTTPPAFAAGGGNSDYALEIHGGLGLKVDQAIIATSSISSVGVNSQGGSILTTATTSSIPHGAFQVVGNTGLPAFQNSWVNFSSTGNTVANYYLAADGRVHLGGTVKSGTMNACIFTLPAGSRPTKSTDFATVSNGAFGYLSVNTAGCVLPVSGSNAWFSLDGISFDTTQP